MLNKLEPLSLALIFRVNLVESFTIKKCVSQTKLNPMSKRGKDTMPAK